MLTIGIDPGLTGAAVLTGAAGQILECAELPVCTRPAAGGKVANWLDARALGALLRDWSGRHEFVQHAVCVVIEQPRPMPSMPSTTSASLFDTVGAIRGVVAALNVGAVLHADPQAWKRHFGLKAGDKNAARECAQRLFAASAGLFARCKDHNRAEAALLAYWGRIEVDGEWPKAA